MSFALAGALGLGLGLGVLTGIPIGVINMAIVDAVTAGRRRFALGLGLGGGVADAIHALLAFAGIGRVVLATPALVRGLAIAAAITITGYAIVAWRRRRRVIAATPVRTAATAATETTAATAATAPLGAPPPTEPAHAVLAGKPPDPPGGNVARGAMTGFALTLPNPGALAAWVAMAAAIWPRAAPLEAGLVASGVGVGSVVWFATLARWLGRVRPDHPALVVIPKIAMVVLIGLAVAGVIRSL